MTSYYKIPLLPTPNQVVNTTINDKAIEVSLALRKNNRLYATISINNETIISSRVCLDRTALTPEWYKNKNMVFTFVDSQGYTDPEYSGLGSRYNLFMVAVDG